MDGWMDGWMSGWVDEWVDGWMDGWMDGWTGEWVDERNVSRKGIFCNLCNGNVREKCQSMHQIKPSMTFPRNSFTRPCTPPSIQALLHSSSPAPGKLRIINLAHRTIYLISNPRQCSRPKNRAGEIPDSVWPFV